MLRVEAGGHMGEVRKVLFSSDGSRLVSVGHDKVIRIWDLAAAKQIGPGIRYPIGPGPQGGIYAAALINGNRLVVGGFDVFLRRGASVFDLQTPSEVHSYLRVFDLETGKFKTLESGQGGPITSIAASVNGEQFASASTDGKVIVWSSRDLQVVKRLAHKKAVSEVAFSEDSSHIATGGDDGTLRIWNVSSGNVEKSINCGSPIQCMAWSPNGKTLAAGTLDSKIRLWNAGESAPRQVLSQADNPTCLAFSKDSGRLLSGSGENEDRDDCKVRVWSTVNGELETTYSGHSKATILCAALSPSNSGMAASGDRSGEIKIWNASTGRTLQRLKGGGASVFAVGWSADGGSVAWSTELNGPLARSFSLNRALPGPAVRQGDQAAWRRSVREMNGQTITVVNALPGTGNSAVVLSRNGREVKRIKVQPFDQIHGATFTKDGQIVIASDFGLALFSSGGALQRQMVGHTGSILDVSVSPNGKYLASASSDQTVRIWSLSENGREIAGFRSAVLPLVSLFSANNSEWVAWTEKGFYASSPMGDDLIGWQVNTGPDSPPVLRTAFEMKDQFYRPAAISRLVETGSLEEAVKVAVERKPVDLSLNAAEVAQKLPSVTVLDVGSAEKRGEDWVATSPTVQVRVSVLNSDSPDSSVTIRVNRPASSKRLEEVKRGNRPGERILDAVLTQGDNVLTVVAKNKAGESAPATVRVAFIPPKPIVREPGMQVLAIGVSQYGDPNIDALRFASRDAEEIGGVYRGQSGKLFKSVEIKTLTNKQATRTSLLAALDAMQKSLTAEDTAILFVSSHGFANNDEFFFALSDASLSKLGQTGVSWREVLKRLESLPAKNVILMVDQCHSGGVQEELIRGYHPQNEALRSARQSNILTFCASNANEISWEHPKWQHGAFTFALLTALRGEAKEVISDGGRILLSRVEDYVTGEVERMVQEVIGSKQTPSLFCMPGGYKRIPIAKQ